MIPVGNLFNRFKISPDKFQLHIFFLEPVSIIQMISSDRIDIDICMKCMAELQDRILSFWMDLPPVIGSLDNFRIDFKITGNDPHLMFKK